jgi:hypothetical protein
MMAKKDQDTETRKINDFFWKEGNLNVYKSLKETN